MLKSATADLVREAFIGEHVAKTHGLENLPILQVKSDFSKELF
jgi:hypothetical protein